ncbi:CsbD family protein [Fulvimarina sp. 2208YS6-2-32]|uniref:CsbD family protein n=1 Tax=Fulvimarina uroteuthidis TaxID=3098149 RepID=A0ABU5HZY3_9HYPH|nr:CsbD family protein [Fulvimarina sp. 2208YS6-2-32]MDY8108620.1 CsbD family protein [Fulvimarina sp. 2208YS6-2-32]
MVDKNEIKGGAKEAGGKLKEAVGSALGNEKMEAEGKADQLEGKTQKNYGKVKDAVTDQTR